jgi:hypothetical protein
LYVGVAPASRTSPCLTGFLGDVKEGMEEVEEASLSGVLLSIQEVALTAATTHSV